MRNEELGMNKEKVKKGFFNKVKNSSFLIPHSSLEEVVLYCRSQENYLSFCLNFPQLVPQILHFPLIDAVAVELSELEKEEIKAADYLIFSSPKAVKFFDFFLFTKQKIICLGEGSETELKAKNLPVFLTAPPPFTTEALLSVFKPVKQKIIILAAQGGRDVLENELKKENKVKKIFNYLRINPSLGKKFPEEIKIKAVLISSGSVLENLVLTLPNHLIKLIKCNSLIIVPSKRVFDLAKNYGFEIVLNAKSASDLGQITALNLCLQEKIYD